MIQLGKFWILLAASVPLFWLLPKRLRYAFLALVSIALIALIAPSSAVAVTAWSIAFYLLAPLAAKKPARSRALQPVAVGVSSGGAEIASDSCDPSIVPDPSIDFPKSRGWITYVLIVGVLLHLIFYKAILPLLRPHRAGVILPIVIPLGMSYFTFKLIHYAIEVKRGAIKQRNFQQFLCYMFIFPAYSAGPIERFDHFLANQADSVRLDMLGEGTTRIIYGLIKKFLITGLWVTGFTLANASTLGRTVGSVPPTRLWRWMIYSYLYVYFDFSAYSDIAIGACQLYGIRIMENFNWPITSPNIGAFWKRWHITLAGWCQSYIFMPFLAWWRNPYLALGVTFLAIGLWHGTSFNWAIWGLYHAGGILIYQSWVRFKRKRQSPILNSRWLYPVGVAVTFLFVSFGMVFTLDGVGTNYDLVRVIGRLAWLKLPMATTTAHAIVH